jgi:ribonuclease-3
MLELEKFLILGSAYKKNLKIEDKILGDACEALIGAIYLDSGFKVVENFILKLWDNEIKKTVEIEINPKTKLQEFSLKYFKKLPTYKVLSCKGPQHKPSYKVSVKIYGTGNSKKIAEHNAARKIIKGLRIN